MTRLIDADALKSKMDGYWGRCQRIRKPRNGETAVFLDIKATVEAQPTVLLGTATQNKQVFDKYCDLITAHFNGLITELNTSISPTIDSSTLALYASLGWVAD